MSGYIKNSILLYGIPFLVVLLRDSQSTYCDMVCYVLGVLTSLVPRIVLVLNKCSSSITVRLDLHKGQANLRTKYNLSLFSIISDSWYSGCIVLLDDGNFTGCSSENQQGIYDVTGS